MFEFVEHVVYINLDKRNDRRQHIIAELLKVFPEEKIHRFSAIYNQNGALGCYASHIAVLKMAKENQWANVLVVEDDFTWQNMDAGAPVFSALGVGSYDAILLSGFAARYDANTYKLHSSLCSTGYLINSHYYDTLIECFENGMHLFSKVPFFGARPATYPPGVLPLDKAWNPLQQCDNWFIVVPYLCRQMAGWSDIGNRYEGEK